MPGIVLDTPAPATPEPSTRHEMRGAWEAYLLAPGKEISLAEIHKLAARYGLKAEASAEYIVCPDDYSEPFHLTQWRNDGCIRTASAEGHKSTASNLLHELGHYVVASNREALNWGLGIGPEDGNYKDVEDSPEDSNEESFASMMGILLERYCGGDARYTLEEHQWYFENQWSTADHITIAFDVAIRQLLAWGLVDADLRPTFKIR